MKINFFNVARMLIGALFIVSGLEKLLAPYQNFLYVIENYEFFPPVFANLAAHVVPWVEVFLGLFLFIGLWLNLVLPAVMVMILSFILLISQALIRKLPIVECGCFGELISFPLHVTFMLDTILLAVTILMFCRIHKTSVLSLDAYYRKS